MSAIERQEELIEKLQDAVSYYLNEGQFETAKDYSELLKLACEAYRDLKGEPRHQVQELTQRQPTRPFDSSKGDTKYFSSKIPKTPEQNPAIYQQRMQAEYAYTQPQQQPRTVISAYTYGDGADNPKIRASDGAGNWKYEEPNVVITPQQQLIPNKFQQSTQQQAQFIYEDVWSDDSNDMSFQDPRRNGFYSQ